MMISVDPGIQTGFAIWNGKKLDQVGTVRFDANLLHWEDKVWDVATKFQHLFLARLGKIDIAYFEYPTYMGGTGGHMVATSGDLVKLAVITGVVMQVARDQGAGVVMVPVNKWKGQLPKDICKARAIKAMPGMGLEKMSDHAWDAIGIGLWVQGRF